MHQDEALLEKRILLLGCDPAFSILNAHVTRYGKGAELLSRFGIPTDQVKGYDKTVSSHIEGARMVAFGLADAALGLRALAVNYQLDFVPIQFVRCDLIIRQEFHELPAIKILLDVLQTKALRQDLSTLPGYASSMTGKIVGQF